MSFCFTKFSPASAAGKEQGKAGDMGVFWSLYRPLEKRGRKAHCVFCAFFTQIPVDETIRKLGPSTLLAYLGCIVLSNIELAKTL